MHRGIVHDEGPIGMALAPIIGEMIVIDHHGNPEGLREFFNGHYNDIDPVVTYHYRNNQVVRLKHENNNPNDHLFIDRLGMVRVDEELFPAGADYPTPSQLQGLRQFRSEIQVQRASGIRR